MLLGSTESDLKVRIHDDKKVSGVDCDVDWVSEVELGLDINELEDLYLFESVSSDS